MRLRNATAGGGLNEAWLQILSKSAGLSCFGFVRQIPPGAFAAPGEVTAPVPD